MVIRVIILCKEIILINVFGKKNLFQVIMRSLNNEHQIFIRFSLTCLFLKNNVFLMAHTNMKVRAIHIKYVSLLFI